MAYDITLVTYDKFPSLTPDDQLLVSALRKYGVSSRSAIWSDPEVDWNESRFTLIRSTWDYFHQVEQFTAWLDLTATCTELANGINLLRWNTDKRYLRYLIAKGVAVVPTIYIEALESAEIRHQIRSSAWRNVVIKPCVGGSAYGTRRFRLPGDLSDACEHAEELRSRGPCMLQPFVAEVESAQERSLVYLAGRFSHAVRKPAFAGGFAMDLTPPQAHRASKSEIDFADNVLAHIGPTDYARVDIVPTEHNCILLMELELLEPSLFFCSHFGAAELLSEHIVKRIVGATR